MTATEVSRNFSAVLDGAERGETVVVMRNGRRVAVLGPAAAANGAAVQALFAGVPVDPDFADDVRSVREDALMDGPAWPDD